MVQYLHHYLLVSFLDADSGEHVHLLLYAYHY